MPTSYAVLDSGILLASIQQNEPYTLNARTLIERLLASSVQPAAPALLRYELVAVVRKWVYRGLTSPQQADQALEVLLSYPVTQRKGRPKRAHPRRCTTAHRAGG